MGGELHMADAITWVVVRTQNAVAGLRDREEGQGLVEYVVLIALIALLLFAAIQFGFAGKLGTIFSKIGNILEEKIPAS
jgi:Flp pilus assembly pilin Flp